MKALRSDELLPRATEQLKSEGTPEEETKKSKAKSIVQSLTVLAVASVFSFDLIFSDFGNTNILPHFIYGLILFYAIFTLSQSQRTKILLSAMAGAFTLAAIITHLLTSRFFEKYDYIYLLYSTSAKRYYLPVKIAAVFELIAVLALLTVCVIAFREFTKENTAFSPDDEKYGMTSKKCHDSLIRRGTVMFSMAGLINLLKCINVFLKGNVKLAFSAVNEEGFATGTLPWMSTLIFGLCVIYVIYSFYFISDVKGEVRLKYDTENE